MNSDDLDDEDYEPTDNELAAYLFPKLLVFAVIEFAIILALAIARC